MRRTQLIWAAIFGLFFAAFVSTVTALNSDLYSAHGFVRNYLDAVARHDTTAALDMPGVSPPGAAGPADVDDLLVPATLAELGGIALASDTPEASGVHRVRFDVAVDGTPVTAQYLVERAGTAFALFPTWRFVESPLATVAVTVLHARTFEANGVTASTDAPNSPAAYRMFTPGRYLFTHQSAFLEAAPQEIVIPDAGAESSVTVNVEASEAFTNELSAQVAEFLDACARQRVLLPTGCPFGFPVSDRIIDEPSWSIAAYPEVRIEPGNDVGAWRMPATEGVAHITVRVRSLFDGTVRTTDEDVPFLIGYTMTITPDGGLVATVEFE